MTYDGKEASISAGQPYELYLFQTRTDAWHLTSADEEKQLRGAVYKPEAIIRTGTSANAEVKGGHITVIIPKDHAIAQLFVAFIPSTPLTLTIFRAHEGEPESETKVLFVGRVIVGRFTTDDTCELECAPDTDVLKRDIATACYQRSCNHVLFSPGCGLSSASWRQLGVVGAISDDGMTVTVAALAAETDGWFNIGYLEKGGQKRMILTHAGSTITLLTPIHGLNVGDEVGAYAGCDRSYAGANGCSTKFNNGANFMGFEWIPGKNPFTKGLEN